MNRIFGVDVSTHQKEIDWQSVKNAGVKFAIIRAGYGQNTVDKYFERNVTECIRLGIPFGAYWFIYGVNENEAIMNAEICHKVLSPYKDKMTLRVWCDLEYDTDKKANNKGVILTKALRTAMVKAFCERMKSYGYDVGNYSNRDYLRSKFDDLSQYPLWYARYDISEDKMFSEYKPLIWQYSSKGSVNGITGNVDMNYMYIDDNTDKKEEETMKTYKKGVKVQITPNFKSTEFDCNGKGCCTETPIHTKLVEVLQDVRDHFGVSVNVNSGYRCPVHNANVSGASANSWHMKGYAADINTKNVHPMCVARYVEEVFAQKDIKGRIGCYTYDDSGKGFVHIDVRGTNSRAIYTENNVKYDTVSHFHPSIKRGVTGREVKVVQRRLKKLGYYNKSIDGSCGAGMEQAIIKFNAAHGRKNDAVFGPKCWNEAFPY